MLLLYGDKTEEFEDALKSNGEGEIEHVIEKKAYKVFHRIYLSLQEDEVELANLCFVTYQRLINYYLQNEGFSLEQYLMHLQPEFAQEVTDILMEDERIFTLGRQNIFLYKKGHYRSKCFRDYFNFTLVSSR
jgi:DNA primase